MEKNMAYHSTSKYLRQIMSLDKGNRKSEPTTARSSLRTPAYKTQEEYYDEVLQLRKQIGALSQENSTIKTKLRRLEEDNQRKEKEISGLLNPGKHEDFHRTLRDHHSNSSGTIHGLKQKILKLETQLKEKETSYNKLKSDLKTTKIEELRIQMETLYQEIVRLQNFNGQSQIKGNTKEKYNQSKVKVLSETILQLNKNVEQLQSENQTLKKDLENALDTIEQNRTETASDDEYEDMNRKELLNIIRHLQNKMDAFEKERNQETHILDTLDTNSTHHIPGKLVLRGTLAERLDSLDKQETKLLEELEKSKVKIKQLKAEKY